MTIVLALDIGTSSARAKVYDERGGAVQGAEGQAKYEVAAEFDADRLVAATREAIEGALAHDDEVAAVCASCFWHSVMAVDRNGRAASPLFSWRDTRSVGAADRLRGRLDADAVHARTGCVLHTSFWPAKLAWLREEQPDVFVGAHRFLSFSDYLYLRLVGDSRTSLSMASGTGLLDLNECAWDEELLDVLGLEPDRLPEISDEPAGEDTPWFPALGDGACSNVGAGCLTPERAALMIGTSGAYRIVREAERASPRRGLFCYRLDGRRLVEGGALSDGGNLYEWLERTLRLEGSESAAERDPLAHGLTFLTLLGGERSPGWNARARGAIAGLTFETTPRDLLQAGLEGVAFRFAEISELMPEVREVVATGHALLANPDWTQILADVLGRAITASGVEEASARGAAVVTLERLGEKPGEPPLGRVFEPREERVETYRLARERQRNLYTGAI